MRQLLLFIFLFYFQLTSFSQSPAPVKNIVFEGAGIRGIAYAGVVKELEDRHLLAGIEKVGGTSAGAITALVISLGYNGNEIADIIGKTNFKKFNDGRFLLLGGINRTSKYFGWYRGRRFEKWLSALIVAKTDNENITFEELHKRGFKDLYITGTCLNKQQLIVFSHETYPRMKVKDAVRISMSIPLYFEAVFIDKDGNVVHRPKKKEGLDVMIDGGLTGNFPIRLFDSAGVANPGTIGFRIDSKDQISNDREGKSLVALPVNNFTQYMRAFYTMLIENVNRLPLTKDDWQRTVSIDDGKIGPKIRKLSAEELTTLTENGKIAISEYLR